MRKHIIEYTSPLDALIAIVKQLSSYETKYHMDSGEFSPSISRVKPPTMKILSNGQTSTSTISPSTKT